MMPPDDLLSAQNAPKCDWRPGSTRTHWSTPPGHLAGFKCLTSKEKGRGMWPILYPDFGERSPCPAVGAITFCQPVVTSVAFTTWHHPYTVAHTQF